MKKLFAIATLITGSLVMVSCGDDEGETITEVINELEGGLGVLVEANITSNTTWSADSIYVLADRIAVESGATLTIEAGTIIKGQAGTGANATALVVAQGGTLNAQGTASAPIIFTSVADEITVGQIDSPNLSTDVDGLWGGLIILGNAKISVEGDASSTNIEGIPSTDSNGLYGGSDDSDNSGTITYVSVRHGGANIGEGNEINGITFGGVGSGTTVHHVEVIANQDDGIEWFGGTVSVSHALVLNNGDDAIDTDQAWAGTLDNFVIINPGDKGFELDGPEGTYEGAGHTITNGTVYMGGCAGGYDDDSGTDAIVSNIYFTGVTDGTGTSNDYNVNGNFVATNIEFDVTPVDLDDDGDTPDVAPLAADYFADMVAAGGVITEVTTATVGADETEFSSWTMASLRGEF
ncbi:hypothetical protein [Ekhidna sp.]|jgi:hypothetical protein|uniref:hypothetical protein n=1 Tax=Ekhidna sp. TaxID=2608089 RepID=UPI0032EBA8B7